MKNSRAFTLIELLVVVLIIGILAAVAVPQYQQAVEKSRATEALSILKTIATANRTYYLTHGTYPTNIEELDIEIPGSLVNTGVGKRTETKYFQYGPALMENDEGIAIAKRLPTEQFYTLTYYQTGEICCFSFSTKGTKFCNQLSNGKTTSKTHTTKTCYLLFQ